MAERSKGKRTNYRKPRRSKGRRSTPRRSNSKKSKPRKQKKGSKKKVRAGTGVKKKLPYTQKVGKYPSYGPKVYIKKQERERKKKAETWKKDSEMKKIKNYLEKKRKERSKAPTISEILERENKSIFQWKREQALQRASRTANPPPGQM